MGQKEAPVQVQGADEDDEAASWNPIKVLFLIVALGSQYMCQMLFIIGAGVYQRDIAAVVGDPQIASWASSCIVIVPAFVVLPVAQASDYWGRKWLIVIPTFVGFIGSMIVARASSMRMAIVGFALGGVAFGPQPLLHAVASEVMPRKYRSFAQAAINSSISIGAIMSLTIGGSLTENNPAGFRTYWYICGGIFVFSSVLIGLLYNPAPRELQITLTQREKLRAMDWWGLLMFNVGLVLFCLGLSYSQNPFSWSDAHVTAPFAIGCVFLVALVVYEWKFKKDGLFHHDLFHNRNFALALIGIWIEGFVFMAANLWFPYSMSVLLAGQVTTFRVLLCYCVAWAMLLVGALLMGVWIYKTRTVRIPAMASFVSFLIFCVLMASIDATERESHFWGFICFYGLGLGSCIISLYTTAQLSTPPQHIALATGLLGSIRSVGGSIAVAVQTAIFTNGLTAHLFPNVAAAVAPFGVTDPKEVGAIITDLTAGDITSLLKKPNITVEAIGAAGMGLKEAYVVAFRYPYVCAGAFSFLAIILMAFLKNPRDEFNAKVDAPLEGTALVRDLEEKRVSFEHVETREVRD